MGEQNPLLEKLLEPMKIRNYKEGDIYPENREIREHLFKLGEKYERELDKRILSNENVEIKTQGLDTTQQYGNIFVETSSYFPDKGEQRHSGISITHCETWIFAFNDENGNLLPFSINLNTEYLLDTITKGLKEGWVKEQTTQNLETGDINCGYLIPILFLFEPVLSNTYEGVVKLFFERKNKIDWSDFNKRKQRLQELTINKKNK